MSNHPWSSLFRWHYWFIWMCQWGTWIKLIRLLCRNIFQTITAFTSHSHAVKFQRTYKYMPFQKVLNEGLFFFLLQVHLFCDLFIEVWASGAFRARRVLITLFLSRIIFKLRAIRSAFLVRFTLQKCRNIDSKCVANNKGRGMLCTLPCWKNDWLIFLLWKSAVVRHLTEM